MTLPGQGEGGGEPRTPSHGSGTAGGPSFIPLAFPERQPCAWRRVGGWETPVNKVQAVPTLPRGPAQAGAVTTQGGEGCVRAAVLAPLVTLGPPSGGPLARCLRGGSKPGRGAICSYFAAAWARVMSSDLAAWRVLAAGHRDSSTGNPS